MNRQTPARDETAAAHAEAPFNFKNELVAQIPYLRAIARSLCGARGAADDLTQDALARAWKARASFEPGTNLRAWLVVIMRNQFYSDKRRSWRTQPLDEELLELKAISPEDQSSKLALADLRRALDLLPAEQREALILVGAGGFSYEEAAEMCGCAVGTIKSRVSRARRSLETFLDNPADGTLGTRGSADQAAAAILEEVDALSAGAPPKNAL